VVVKPNNIAQSARMSRENASQGLVIVTGGSRGIGAAIATLAARRGHPVLINYASDAAEAERLIRQLDGEGLFAQAIKADVANEEDVLRLFEAADKTGFRLAGLVNNAGITGGLCRLDELSDDTLRRVLAINVAGCVLCAREAVRRMSTQHGGQGGSIVNISSIAAKLGGAGEWIHYAASKGAVDTLTIGLSREVAAENIRVNAVSPGLIETTLHAASGAPDRLERMIPNIPMRRPGTAEEVAEAVLWLMSPAASYITGAIVPAGGGR
jgi:NAD(P)-dependent dehydrogenase (short-subunit alcohol dehydrogenase family)